MSHSQAISNYRAPEKHSHAQPFFYRIQQFLQEPKTGHVITIHRCMTVGLRDHRLKTLKQLPATLAYKNTSCIIIHLFSADYTPAEIYASVQSTRWARHVHFKTLLFPIRQSSIFSKLQKTDEMFTCNDSFQRNLKRPTSYISTKADSVEILFQRLDLHISNSLVVQSVFSDLLSICMVSRSELIRLSLCERAFDAYLQAISIHMNNVDIAFVCYKFHNLLCRESLKTNQRGLAISLRCIAKHGEWDLYGEWKKVALENNNGKLAALLAECGALLTYVNEVRHNDLPSYVMDFAKKEVTYMVKGLSHFREEHVIIPTLEYLSALCAVHPETHVCFRDLNGVHTLLEIMKLHKSCGRIMELCCMQFNFVADTFLKIARQQIVNKEVSCGAILRAIKQLPHRRKLVEASCSFLVRVASADDNHRKEIVEYDALKIIRETVELHMQHREIEMIGNRLTMILSGCCKNVDSPVSVRRGRHVQDRKDRRSGRTKERDGGSGSSRRRSVRERTVPAPRVSSRINTCFRKNRSEADFQEDVSSVTVRN